MIRPLFPLKMNLSRNVRFCFKLPKRSLGTGVDKVAESSRESIVKHQNEFFTKYKARLLSDSVPRIEKIEVQYTGHSISDDATLLMNRRLSTPYHCAMHISKELARDSVLAYVKKSHAADREDGTIVKIHSENENEGSPNSDLPEIAEESVWLPWDMNRPLEFDCELKLLHFNMNSSAVEETKAVNRAYWDSCALVLGAVALEAFKEELNVQLVHLPHTCEESGAFCYDVDLTSSLLNSDGSSKWSADEAALINFTKLARTIISGNLSFERLELHKEDALCLFKHNEHFLRRVEEGSFKTVQNSCVPVYRFGKYIDICDGPLIPSTSSMYHFVVTAAHQLRQRGTPTCLWRFQGISLPKQLEVHHAIWTILEHRARSLVKQNLPFAVMDSTMHEVDYSLHERSSIENRTKKYNIATGQWRPNQWESLDRTALKTGVNDLS